MNLLLCLIFFCTFFLHLFPAFIQLKYYTILKKIGTPIQNNIPELFSLLNFMHTEEFKEKEKFLEKFGTISTDEQVKELQEILRECYSLVLSAVM